MADYIRFKPNGIIVKKYRSVDGSDIKDDADVLKIDRATLDLITKYYKVDNGQVVEMSQVEKDALDAAEVQAALDAQIAQIDELEVTVKDVILALIKRINVRIPSNPITKAEVIQQIKDDKGL